MGRDVSRRKAGTGGLSLDAGRTWRSNNVKPSATPNISREMSRLLRGELTEDTVNEMKQVAARKGACKLTLAEALTDVKPVSKTPHVREAIMTARMALVEESGLLDDVDLRYHPEPEPTQQEQRERELARFDELQRQVKRELNTAIDIKDAAQRAAEAAKAGAKGPQVAHLRGVPARRAMQNAATSTDTDGASVTPLLLPAPGTDSGGGLRQADELVPLSSQSGPHSRRTQLRGVRSGSVVGSRGSVAGGGAVTPHNTPTPAVAGVAALPDIEDTADLQGLRTKFAAPVPREIDPMDTVHRAMKNHAFIRDPDDFWLKQLPFHQRERFLDYIHNEESRDVGNVLESKAKVDNVLKAADGGSQRELIEREVMSWAQAVAEQPTDASNAQHGSNAFVHVDENAKRIEEDELLLRDPKNGDFEKTRVDMLEAAKELTKCGDDVFGVVYKILNSQQFLQKYFHRRSTKTQTAVSIEPDRDVKDVDEIAPDGMVNDLVLAGVGLTRKGGTVKFNADPSAELDGAKLEAEQIRALRLTTQRCHEKIIQLKEERDTYLAHYRLNMSLKTAEVNFLRSQLVKNKEQIQDLVRGVGFTALWEVGEGEANAVESADALETKAVDAFSRIRAEVVAKNNQAREHAQELAEENKKKRQEAEEAQELNKMLQDRISILYAEKESEIGARDHQIAELEETITDRDSSLRKMQIDVSIAKDRLAQMQEQLAEQKSDQRVFHEQIDALKSQLEDAVPLETHHKAVETLKKENRKIVVLEKLKRALMNSRISAMQTEITELQQKVRQESTKADMKIAAFGRELENANSLTAEVVGQLIEKVSEEGDAILSLRQTLSDCGADEVTGKVWMCTSKRIDTLLEQLEHIAVRSPGANAFATALQQANTALKDVRQLTEPEHPDELQGMSLLRTETDRLTQNLEVTSAELDEALETAKETAAEVAYAKELFDKLRIALRALGSGSALEKALEVSRSFVPVPGDVGSRDMWVELDRTLAGDVLSACEAISSAKTRMSLYEMTSNQAIQCLMKALRDNMTHVLVHATEVGDQVAQRLDNMELVLHHRTQDIVAAFADNDAAVSGLAPDERKLLETYRSQRTAHVRRTLDTKLQRAVRRAAANAYLKRVLACIKAVASEASFPDDVATQRLLCARESRLMARRCGVEVTRLADAVTFATEQFELCTRIETLNSKLSGGDVVVPAVHADLAEGSGGSPTSVPRLGGLEAAAGQGRSPQPSPRTPLKSEDSGIKRTHSRKKGNMSPRGGSADKAPTRGRSGNHMRGNSIRDRPPSANTAGNTAVAALQEQCTQQQQRVEACEAEITDLRGQLENSKEELQAARDSCSALEREVADLNNALDEAELHIHDLEEAAAQDPAPFAPDSPPAITQTPPDLDGAESAGQMSDINADPAGMSLTVPESGDVSIADGDGTRKWSVANSATSAVHRLSTQRVSMRRLSSRRGSRRISRIVDTADVEVQTVGVVLCDATTETDVTGGGGLLSAGGRRASGGRRSRKSSSGSVRRASSRRLTSRPGTGAHSGESEPESPERAGSFLFAPWDGAMQHSEENLTALTLKGRRDGSTPFPTDAGPGTPLDVLGGMSPLPRCCEQGTSTDLECRKSSARPPRVDSLKPVVLPTATTTCEAQTDVPSPVAREERATSVPNFPATAVPFTPIEVVVDPPDPDPDASCKYCGTQFQSYPYCPFSGTQHHWHMQPPHDGADDALKSKDEGPPAFPVPSRKAREALTGSWGGGSRPGSPSPAVSPNKFGLASTTTRNVVERVDITDDNDMHRPADATADGQPRELPHAIGRKLTGNPGGERGARPPHVSTAPLEYPYMQYSMSPPSALSQAGDGGWALPNGYKFDDATPTVTRPTVSQPSMTPTSQRVAGGAVCVLRQRTAGEWTEEPYSIYHEARETKTKLMQTAKLLDMSLRANERLNRTVDELVQQPPSTLAMQPPPPRPASAQGMMILAADEQSAGPTERAVSRGTVAVPSAAAHDDQGSRPASGSITPMVADSIAMPAVTLEAPLTSPLEIRTLVKGSAVDQNVQTEPFVLDHHLRSYAIGQYAPNRFLTALRAQSEYLYHRMRKFLDVLIADEFRVPGAAGPLSLLPARRGSAAVSEGRPTTAAGSVASRPGSSSMPLPAIEARRADTQPAVPAADGVLQPTPEITALVLAPSPAPLDEAVGASPGAAPAATPSDGVLIKETDLERDARRQPKVPSVHVTLSRPGSSQPNAGAAAVGSQRPPRVVQIEDMTIDETVAEGLHTADDNLAGLSVDDFKRLEEEWRRDATAKWQAMRVEREREQQEAYLSLKCRERDEEKRRREERAAERYALRSEVVVPTQLAPVDDAPPEADMHEQVANYLLKRADEVMNAQPIAGVGIGGLCVGNGFNGESLDTLQNVTTDTRVANYGKVRGLKKHTLTLDGGAGVGAGGGAGRDEEHGGQGSSMPSLPRPGKMMPNVLLQKQRRSGSGPRKAGGAFTEEAKQGGRSGGVLESLPLSRPTTASLSEAVRKKPPGGRLPAAGKGKRRSDSLTQAGGDTKRMASTLPPAPTVPSIAEVVKVQSHTLKGRESKRMR